jgi:hypothetical protein
MYTQSSLLSLFLQHQVTIDSYHSNISLSAPSISLSVYVSLRTCSNRNTRSFPLTSPS